MKLSKKLGKLTRSFTTGLLFLACSGATIAQGGALENYVQAADSNYSWKIVDQRDEAGFHIARLSLASQKWRDTVWQHNLIVVRPPTVRNPDIAFVFVTGSGAGEREVKIMQMVAAQSGAMAAVITDVPNQPLYDGRKEDALIAYTFAQYLKTGDETWPLLFPMAKSAVKAMDAVQEFAKQEAKQGITRFVVGGASKRGWTTWLAGAVDQRIVGIAPMVIDMLNMRVQTDWEQKVYGKQSEQIQDYVDNGLIKNQDDPRMVQLRNWVDPYSYRNRYTMPKLLLLGTNDPYWTVDSLHNYWDDLPEPKLVFQTPNAGHNLGGGEEAIKTLASFYQMIADHQTLPKASWKYDGSAKGAVKLSEDIQGKATSARLWTAVSTNRDFRMSQWTNRTIELSRGNQHLEGAVETPSTGYRAFLLETTLQGANGASFKLSTEARVTPELK